MHVFNFGGYIAGYQDRILSRPEDNPGYIVQRDWDVSSIAGIAESASSESQTIITTGEHPFYVVGRGWVPAFDLSPGDQLETEDGQTVEILSAEATGKLESVYNVRVAHDHTYFVGSPTWGFAIWVHNTYGVEKRGDKYVVIDKDKNVSKDANRVDESFGTEEAANRRANQLNTNNEPVNVHGKPQVTIGVKFLQ